MLSPKTRIYMWMIVSFISGIIVGDLFEIDIVHREDARPCLQITPTLK
jgi:hypothetical protein